MDLLNSSIRKGEWHMRNGTLIFTEQKKNAEFLDYIQSWIIS